MTVSVTYQHTFHLKETDEETVGLGLREKITLIGEPSSLSFIWHRSLPPSVILPEYSRLSGDDIDCG